jgi:hypothetical protein
VTVSIAAGKANINTSPNTIGYYRIFEPGLQPRKG